MVSENIFKEKEITPTDMKVEESLNLNFLYLKIIRQFILDTFGKTLEEWKFYGVKTGWLLKTFFKKRNLFFISIYDGYFKISFTLGEKVVNNILIADISQELKDELANSKKYAEGRVLTIKVNSSQHIEGIKKIIGFKILK